MTGTNQLTNSIVNYINAHKGFAFRVNSMGVPRKVANGKIIFSKSKNKGIADILCCIDSKFIAIEIKTGRDKQRIEQKAFEENVTFCKGHYWIIKSFDDFLNYWNYFLKTK